MLCSINCRGVKGQSVTADSNLSSSSKLEQHSGTEYDVEKRRCGSSGSDGSNGGSSCSDARESPLVHVRPFICDKARGKQKGWQVPEWLRLNDHDYVVMQINSRMGVYIIMHELSISNASKSEY